MNETQKDELIYEYHKNNMAKLIRLCQPMLVKMGGISRKDYEDFYEIASDVVMSSVNTYDDSKSSFHTYITGNITRKFKTELRDRNRKKRIPAKQLISIHMKTDDGLSLEDTIPSKFDVYKELYGENISDIRIRNYLNRLSNKQRKIVSLLAQGYQSKEIKDLLHMNNKEYLENISIIQAYENIRELKRNVD